PVTPPTTLAAVWRRLVREGLVRLREGAPAPAPAPDRPVANVTTDSRQVGEGTLFCAIVGTESDGHRYLAEAEARGAAGALVEVTDPALALPQVEVVAGRPAAAHAAAELYRDPWRELTLVGVTGTNGKTTSAAILRHLLGTRGPAASVGTLGAVGPDGRVVPGTEGLTTPGPAEAARWLRLFADAGVEGVAMETSSHALDQDRLAAVRFDAAVFTNLTRDHLDYHGTMEAYRAAKLRLLGLLKPGGAAVLNAGDPAWRGVGDFGGRVVRFGVGVPGAEVRAEEVALGPGGMEWTLVVPGGRARVRLPLFGAYNVENALGCAAALWSLGWSAAEVAAGVETLPQVPGRLERVAGPPDSATVVLDYAHTPDALERALLALRPLVRGRLVVVFGAGGDRDHGKRPLMGEVAARLADLAVVTSDNPRTEDPERILDDIERGMGSAPRLRLSDRREAIRRALLEAGEDDLVLLAGKGHETYQQVGREQRPFDERAVVREVLAGRETTAGHRGGAG
ncbi:MAG TPA: UDP-N-acetylmuramoyl-L-alanyl-D-glutamate--2,6-diaminopimelate ligase, partial [Longimicrobiaceae bacterium]|nr:UDP-N-acetylmuramoyl-L-alanyl-D-glutamate--2,6-diaminopimelate ligase [Longimicrobiaceae bacterium]